jgi:hypothetical protein
MFSHFYQLSHKNSSEIFTLFRRPHRLSITQVCTAQYFLWYVCLLPLALPQTRIPGRWQGASMCLLWFVCELHWLYWGYRLEFVGDNVFLQLWGASMLFFGANVLILWILIRNHKFAPLFKDGKVNKIFGDDRRSKNARQVADALPRGKAAKARATRRRAKTPVSASKITKKKKKKKKKKTENKKLYHS